MTLINVNVSEFFNEWAASDASEKAAMIAITHLFSVNYWEKIIMCLNGTMDPTMRFYSHNKDMIATTAIEKANGSWVYHLNTFARFLLKVNKNFNKRTGLHLMSYLTKDADGNFVLSELKELAEEFIDEFEKKYGSFEEFERTTSAEMRERLKTI